MADPRIGFIGLGRMGGGVALNLRRAGYEVCVYDQRAAAADELVNAGCVLGADVSEVAERSDVVFTSLPDPRAVQAVANGDRGLRGRMRPGSAWFDLSTNAPSVIRQLRSGSAVTPRSMTAARRYWMPSATTTAGWATWAWHPL